MDCRVRNFPTKRIFGKDITNVEQRRPKAASISEKSYANQERPRSLSTSLKAELPKEATQEYESEILAHMLAVARKDREEVMSQVSAEMRAILVDWLVDVHASF
jgi:hypothetical protein